MRTSATATLTTMALCAALLTGVLSALPAFAGGTQDCSPDKCPSPVLVRGHHQDVESR